MRPVFTSAQSRAFDQYVINTIGIPTLVLMENAARGVVDALKDWVKDNSSARVTILCGPGNNGGDGIAVGRLLLDSEVQVQVVLCADRQHFTPDTRAQLAIMERTAPDRITDWTAECDLTHSDIIVDALLGTGSSGPLRGTIRAVVEALSRLQSSATRILSIDIPTGLNPDAGSHETVDEEPLIVKADRTVTMVAPKLGFFKGRSKAFCGDVRIASIGAPADYASVSGQRTYAVQPRDIERALPRLENEASKFSRGRVLAVCGSRGMTGAAIMAATAALRSGCGLVNVAVPKSERSLVAQAMPELLTVGCTEQDDGAPDIAAWDELQEHIDRADALLIGSGLRPWRGTAELLRKIMLEVEKPMVIDAGALGSLVGHLDILKQRTAPTILTPHSGEIARLVERPWEEVELERLEVAREIATRYNVIVVMKGAPTYTIDSNGTAYINTSGNAGLATAGSGDVLAGIMAGTLVQMRARPLEAAMIAVYLHGLAGDFAAEAKTKPGMTATDITEMMPLAFKKLGVH